jgi:hypothetical protein
VRHLQTDQGRGGGSRRGSVASRPGRGAVRGGAPPGGLPPARPRRAAALLIQYRGIRQPPNEPEPCRRMRTEGVGALELVVRPCQDSGAEGLLRFTPLALLPCCTERPRWLGPGLTPLTAWRSLRRTARCSSPKPVIA